ncbi:MAG: fused response regulator/phosphatase [Steroidobacteraceae bacterium]|nr:fused response regulator/phosphatase [Steroidobacteraceae bacterium]
MNPGAAAVLVVDDVAENRDILVRHLRRLGIGSIVEAENGVEALAATERRSFDLMLLDITMPELDGYEVLRRLKHVANPADLPVIVISALSEIEPVVRCVELGAEDFILKPFNPTLLRARITATLEKKGLRDLTREELRRRRAELEEARGLQLALVPPKYRATHHGRSISIDVALEPAREVGGDLADHFLVGSDRIVLVLGDVSDKGAGAALVMARTHALLRGLALRPDAIKIFGCPERAVDIVNRALSLGNDRCMFVTMLLAVLDTRSGRLSYVRAGHIPPFVGRSDGRHERLSARGGPPLGLDENAVYSSTTVRLHLDDHLLIVTDGITEAMDASGQLFGEERVRLLMCVPASAETVERLVSTVRAFESGHPPSDDVAILHLRSETPT